MSNPLHALHELGQSVWFDGIRRSFVTRGRLAEYVDEYAVTGVTSNPTIFERAIAGSDDYDQPLRDALDRGVDDAEELFWEVAIEDIRGAADVLRVVHQQSAGMDGYVSLELPPRVTHDTDAAVALAQELFERVDRPNVLIKVTGSAEGVSAVEELVHRGVNVNITLLFSCSRWREVAEAYLRGLERRLEAGLDLEVASVASFFVSRIDAKANERLPQDLHNRLAVANATLAYAAYRELLDSDRWRRLADAGARPQRLLWASTSTKDPSLPETFYVTELAAPDTINTMPEQTLLAFADAGEVGAPLPVDATEAEKLAARAADAGADLDELAAELLDEGDAKFADSFDRLIACVDAKAAALRAGSKHNRHRLGPLGAAAGDARGALADRQAVTRLWKRDHTLWQDDPAEVADRLGWLVVAEEMEAQVEGLQAFTGEVVADGLSHVLVLGMGGSSLFPMVAGQVLAGADSGLELHVLDSVHPAAVRRVEKELPLDSTLVVAASKSGTTVETRALLERFWEQHGDPDRFVAITDPGTALAQTARKRGFRRVFEARPDLGGRYSALSHFGLVPAALAGADVGELLHRAGRMAAGCADCVQPEANPGLRLAVALAGGVRSGRDKLTLVTGDRLASFGLWIEQLVAESTGKRGTGIVPVVGEPLGAVDVYGDDRLFVSVGADPVRLDSLADAGHPVVALALDEPADLGAEVLRWQIAVALAGAALDVNPFDQPDVEAAKGAARDALDTGVEEPAPQPLGSLLDQLRPGDYLAIQAYLDPSDPRVAELERSRAVLRDRHRVATTLGVGPRYLHSTGQLHKGGPDSGVFVQVVADDTEDLAIPGERFGFCTLVRAQAAGDLHALHERGRRAARVEIDELVEVGR